MSLYKGPIMKRLLSIFLLSLMLPTLVLGQSSDSLDASFSNPTNMTDEQMKNAKEFVHTGIKNREYNEACKDLNNCSAEDEGMPLESIIGKMYALIFGGLLGGGPSLKVKPKPTGGTATGTTPPATGSEAAPANSVEKKDDTRADYCMYAAMAYETIGGMLQQSLQQKADKAAEASGDFQLQTLVSLKETHKARKKTATWQAALYGGIASCYGVMAFTGVQTDWKFWAKLSGAVALTGLYMKKANKHAKAAKKVQLVIDALPKAGDCNPWTGTACFCKELTSKATFPMEYEEVCVLNKGNFETPQVALGCGTMVDNKLTYDKECKCKQNNTCFKATLTAVIPKLNIGTNFMNQANTGFDLLNSGNMDEGKLATYATGAAGMANKLKPKTPVTTPKVNLNAEQQKVADTLAPLIGPGNAALAAVSPAAGPTGGYSDPPISSAALSKLKPEIKEKIAEAIKGGYKGGAGFQATADSSPDFNFQGFGAQPEQSAGGTEVISFAEQAVSKADVSNAPETPIFDIISNRYRRSAWEKLQTAE